MGKAFWIWQQLERRFGNEIIARYFQAKRKLIRPDRTAYTAADSVAVISQAAGEDLFPWFNSLEIHVEQSQTDIKANQSP